MLTIEMCRTLDKLLEVHVAQPPLKSEADREHWLAQKQQLVSKLSRLIDEAIQECGGDPQNWRPQ